MNRWTAGRRFSVALVALVTVGCARSAQVSSAQETPWVSLFDGRTLNGWRVYQSSAQPTTWTPKEGMLTKSRPGEDIISVDQFGDFELELEWKVSSGGNSGIFYRATEEYDKVYWNSVEYALLDDANARDGRNRITSAGAAHSLYAPPAGIVKAANEWNSTRIVARGGHVEHWLNGTKLFEYEHGSPDWDAKLKASKFAPYANFGKARRGHVAIQGDHGGELAIRNIRIRELR
jgi:hypothetical protein